MERKVGVSKTNKYMQKRDPTQVKGSKLPLFLALAGVVILAITLFFVFRKPASPFTPEITGGPSIKVDKEKVDLGTMKLGKTAQVSFEIKNVGDKPLIFTEAPTIEVKEGCWPPTPAIGSMALAPGESTTLSMEFMMHGEMGGKHDFRVHLPNNDPKQKDMTLIVLSDWVP